MTDDVQLDFDRLLRKTTEQDAMSSTAALYGAAGASFAVILLIAQLGTRTPWIISSLVLASIALPVFTAVAIGEQVVNGIKPPYTGPRKLTSLHKLQYSITLASFFCLLTSVGCLIASMSLIAASVFLVSLVVSALLAFVFVGAAGYTSGVFRDGPESPGNLRF